MKERNNSGQALLIILLIMAVALTIGLSVVSRSVTDIRISQEQEESARVFSAAEAGLESLLATGEAPGSVGDFKIDTGTKPIGDSETFVFPKEIRAGDTQTVWLVDHNEDGTLNLDSFKSFTDFEFHWGNESLSGDEETAPALEAVIIYKNSAGDYTTKRVAFDPKTGRSDGFTSVSDNNHLFGEKTFSFKAEFTEDDYTDSLPSGTLYAIRIKLLYNTNSQILGVKAEGDLLPLQGNCYTSTAASETTGIARKIEQCQLYPSLSGIFDYVLFSESSL